VVPVLDPGVEECTVYLPRGEWVDPWTGDELVGPTVTTCAAPIDRIPVYVAARSAAALAPLFETDDVPQNNSLESMEVSN
jgi:alpha-glucosidase (family GH31 glycosyl hydrolase)